MVLPDHVVVENPVDLARSGQLAALSSRGGLLHLLADDVVAQIHAFVANEYRRPGDELAHLVLALAAE